MAKKQISKSQLLTELTALRAHVRELEDDLIAFTAGLTQVENEMEGLREAFRQSYNPYAKGERKTPQSSSPSLAPIKTDHSIHIDIKR